MSQNHETSDVAGKLVIIDMDNSKVDFSASYEAGLKKILPPEAFENQDITKFYAEERFEPQYHDLVHEMLRSEGFFLNMTPMQGALEAIQEMVEEGIEVIICTVPHPRSDYCIPEKIAWVKKHLGEEFVRKIIFTYDKTVVHGDVIIDDMPEIKGCNKNPSWTHVVFDAEYNQHIDTPYRMKSWENWRDIIYPILKSSD